MGSTYRAFISYSHSDAVFARWLHRRLEAYRLPGGLGRISRAGGRDARLGPIFRDRDELPAAEDLSASVRAALAASDVLVVLCSPDARASAWVCREIALFRELGPDRPILAAIVRGEPREAFPEPLLEGREPLAADLRKQGDGRRLGFLKIVAGIADVPLDALVQRDAQRKLRRVTAVTLAAATAALAMAVMTVIAIQSRNEASRQRNEAESLVEYMLTDLRGELRGVGRLDVMSGVNLRAMDYYENQGDLAGLPPDSLERRARVLHAMVEDETNREGGDLDMAARMAAEAHQTTALLLAAADERSPDLVFEHAQSQYWVGRVYEMREDYAAAQPWYARYDASARQLAAIEPESHRAHMERGFGALNLGIVAFQIEGSGKRPVELFQAAIHWFDRARQLAPANEAVRAELANAYAWLADVHYKAGNFQASLDAQLQAEGLKRALAQADPRDLDKFFSLLVTERALALTRHQLGEHAAARASLRLLAAQTAALSARDPEKREWRFIADKTHADLAQLD